MPINDIRESVDLNAGKAYIIQNGVVEEEPGILKVSTKRNIKTRTRTPIGSRIEQTKPTKVSNSGVMTIDAWAAARFESMVDEFVETGKMPLYDLQIVNEDTSTSVGKRVVRYYNCMLKDDIDISKLEDSDEAFTLDINFSFESKKTLQDFNKPATL